MIKINIRKWAEQYGYKVEIERHGAYTNYFLINDRGCIRIEKDTVKGHTPWTVWANYPIEIPARFFLYFVPAEQSYTIVLNSQPLEFAMLTDADIMRVIVQNGK